jgi:hypothetical protein
MALSKAAASSTSPISGAADRRANVGSAQNGNLQPAARLINEDIELGFRLAKRGFRVVYWPGARRDGAGLTVDQFAARTVRKGAADFIFSRMHSDSLVEQLTRVDEALESWPRLGPGYDRSCGRHGGSTRWRAEKCASVCRLSRPNVVAASCVRSRVPAVAR